MRSLRSLAHYFHVHSRSIVSLRQILVITFRARRTYREGVIYTLDPSEEEIEIAREGDLWKLWNSDRGILLAGIV